MYYQIEQVLEKQQFEVEKFYKGRGILICETPQGLFALKEFHGQMRKAEYLYQVGQFLQDKNISCDAMVKNQEGQLLTEGVDGCRYSAHRWVKGRECDSRSRLDIVMTVSFLAKFHGVSQGAAGLFPEQGEETGAGTSPGTESLYENCQRRDRELRRIRKYILTRKNKSDFERLFLKCFPEYIGQSGEVLDALRDTDGNLKSHTLGLCHGDFNQHNVVIESGGMTLVHMEHMRYGVQMTDLANFLRKMLEKHEWSETLGLEMLREYDRIHPMRAADWKELYCRLCYPEKFWKIANHYFQSNKVWDSGKHYEKLRKENRQNFMRRRFLEALKRARL